MPKTRPPYAPEFRRQMVELVRAGRDPAELAREFEPTAQSISHWVAQADRQEGRREEKGNLVEMMAERGLSMAHTTIMRWVQRYAPEFEKRWRRFARSVGRSVMAGRRDLRQDPR